MILLLYPLLPSILLAATANAISYTNAKPWFFDCDKDLTLDINKLELSLKKNTKLVSRKLIEKIIGQGNKGYNTIIYRFNNG